MLERIKIRYFCLKKQVVIHFCLREFFHAPCFIPLNFTSKDAVFHGLSESDPIFLGHLDNSALPAKILEKFGVKNHQKVLYFDFLLQKWGYIGKAIDRIL